MATVIKAFRKTLVSLILGELKQLTNPIKNLAIKINYF